MTETVPDRDRASGLPAGWEGILDPDERILWQGRPDQRFHVNLLNLPIAVFGLFFAGFALVWMVLAAQAGGIFWMFGLIHFSVGVGILFFALAWGTVKRRGTWYTLSDRRAFIATDLPLRGRRLDSYAITPETDLSLRAGNPGSVIFVREERRGSRGRRYIAEMGFERISEAERVFGLIRAIQRQAPEETT